MWERPRGFALGLGVENQRDNDGPGDCQYNVSSRGAMHGSAQAEAEERNILNVQHQY